MKTRAGNFFEDFRLEQKIRHATPRTLSEGDASLYIALTGTRHVLSSDRMTARALGLRDRPVDDLLVFNIAFGKTVPDISLNAIANLGYADVRFCAPCYAGDTLSAESEVIGLKQNSNGKSGVVWVRSSAFNQNDELVLSWVRWVMVAKRDAGAIAPAESVPELPEAVAAENLRIPAGFNASAFGLTTSGSADLWDDYSAGESIFHPQGVTVEETEHMLATRLYQNNARVHFDALTMKDSQLGRRLVYGGHVISLCRALSHDGIENALLVAAINAGRHVNPVFAGDTITARSEILEKWMLPGRNDLGALRLRLIGLKNCQSAEPSSIKDAEGRYDPHVVLELDYTVFIPRRK